MPRRPVASVLTLGCKLNLADSESIAARLGAAGYDVVDAMCEADAVVVNTCSVTHAADRKSRRLIRAARRLSPAAPVAVTGCYPRSVGEEVVEALGADFVAGTTEAEHARLVETLTASSPAPPPLLPAPTPNLHTRSFVKAQEGCNDVCAFCIVPRTRGREVSRLINDVARDVAAAHARGAREVVLTGTQLGAWGRDLPDPLTPRDLIAGVLARTETPRLRFSSLQPQDITPELLALWDDPRLMPHFHLALQSGADPVLARMRRRYDIADYRNALARIRAAVPDAAVTTDVIAGFPGETDGDFAATLALCEEAAFARIHAFPYSPRARTAAAGMPDQVPVEVRKERMARLLALADDLAAAFRTRFSGSVRPVLWEEQRTTPEGSRWHGLTDNYVSVYAESADDLAGRITPAALGGSFADGLAASVGSAA
ncbi:MAG: MiaB/RimO family radical SAM methylthiotransferase [Chloroflexota bacterium]|nr:MiaB/RimO family radical SAM methylthiotransferase [Chloroflexota bacterium]